MAMPGSPKGGIPHYPCPMCGTPVHSSALTCSSCGTDLTRAGAVFSSSSESSAPVGRKTRRPIGIWLGFAAAVAVAAAAGTVGRPWLQPVLTPGVQVARAAAKTASQWAGENMRIIRRMLGRSDAASGRSRSPSARPRTSGTRQMPSPAPVAPVRGPGVAATPAAGSGAGGSTPAAVPAAAVKQAPAAAVKPTPPEPATQTPAAPAVASATLVVSSTPRGAKVVIDGVARGTTPATVTRLSAGRHRVLISRQGYRTADHTVTVQAGKHVTLSVRLEAQPAVARATTAPSSAKPPAGPLKVGRIAPQFAVKDRVGIIYRAADFRGQRLLLVFVQTLDANAQRIIRELNALRGSGGRDAVVVIVLRPDRRAIRTFVQTEGIHVPVLFGTAELARAYGVGSQPAVLYLVSEDGRVAARQVGRVNPGAVLN